MKSENAAGPTLDTSRNWAFIDARTQAKLADARVVIAGVGGVGGRIAVELTRLGVGSLALADPDIFTATNLNRQEGSFRSTINHKKAEVLARICRDINPGVKVDVYSDGISEDNLEDFAAGADLIVEATDYALPHLGVMLARTARALTIPMITGVEMGFGASVIWFPPRGFTYEKHLGLRPNVNLKDLQSGNVTVNIGRWITHLPSYGKLSSLRQVVAGEKEAPAISPAVGLCSAMAVTQIVAILGGGKTMPPAPAVYSVDVKELRSRVIRRPLMHYRLSLLRLIVKSFFTR